ncbi:MAG: DUF2845 domain-containing protein [Xanthomonadales bacterium]|nr:DUF2845 domain-containing protein [Xanthomonadales bacterium]
MLRIKFNQVVFKLSLLLILLYATDAAALRCGSKLIKEGDPVSRLERYCPEPFWIERWSNPAALDNSPYALQLTDGMEAWYINFGPRKLVRRMVFRNGVLREEQTLAYGFNRAPEKSNCSGSDLDRAGNTLVDLYRRCGEPDHENYYPVTIYPGHHSYPQQYPQPLPGYTYPSIPVVVYRLVWTYYPRRGDSRVFHIENGKVVQRLKYRD